MPKKYPKNNPSAGAGTDYDGSTADWSLLQTSPCINAGTTDTSGLNLPETDFIGEPRVFQGRIDIGAFEYQSNIFIENYLFNDFFHIYPNPSMGKIYLIIENASYENLEIEIICNDGKLIYYSKLKKNISKITKQIDLSNYSRGIYFVKVKCENMIRTEKLIIF